MDYIGIIKRNNLTGDAATVTAALNAKTTRHENNEWWKWASFSSILGLQTTLGIRAKLRAAGLVDYIDEIGAGIKMNDPVTQSGIDGLEAAGVLTPQEAAQFKSIGVWYTSIWADSGGTGEALESDVATALTVVSAQDAIRVLQDQMRVAAQSADNILAQGGTWEAAVAAITGAGE